MAAGSLYAIALFRVEADWNAIAKNSKLTGSAHAYLVVLGLQIAVVVSF